MASALALHSRASRCRAGEALRAAAAVAGEPDHLHIALCDQRREHDGTMPLGRPDK
jgi:hypothetical protein